ncbi:hypothetical protein QP868_10940 [Brevibacterium sp. UMB1308A]|uniref:hypothetical protein n=1 Tax=Brevibacterium sp. UMB1308A TaxID=3050608 RepID=UPI00254D04F0|nr:hypothetical protein [Brevibacterium sp. UMB1308A]MDK8347520.1 hypothetical protein [Brevibacterium sp. UMB1308B]MDK8714409.1 hypothetical protein [Brevibacterium sp. UMB1308A]
MTTWYEIYPLSTQRDFWAVPMWEGKPELGSPTLEDGREVKNVIADGKLDEIPFPIWFERSTYSRGKRRGDILWGGPPTLVSRRFAQAVEELGVTGCSTYEVDLYSLNEGKVEGYIGFAENTRGTSEISSYAWLEKHHSYAWIISERVLTGLHERGIDMFDVKGVFTEKSRFPTLPNTP